MDSRSDSILVSRTDTIANPLSKYRNVGRNKEPSAFRDPSECLVNVLDEACEIYLSGKICNSPEHTDEEEVQINQNDIPLSPPPKNRKGRPPVPHPLDGLTTNAVVKSRFNSKVNVKMELWMIEQYEAACSNEDVKALYLEHGIREVVTRKHARRKKSQNAKTAEEKKERDERREAQKLDNSMRQACYNKQRAKIRQKKIKLLPTIIAREDKILIKALEPNQRKEIENLERQKFVNDLSKAKKKKTK